MTAIEVPRGIRLFATDLDGTLLLPDGSIGQRTREAIDALIERGIVVVFVTGRPPRWIRPIAEMTGHHGTAIGANGALVIDMEAEIIRRVHSIDPASARATADRLRAVTPDITFAVEYAQEGLGLEGSSFALSTGYVARWEIPRGTEILEPDVLFARPGITKLLARPHGNHGHDADTLLDAADRAVADLVEVTHSNSDDVLLEMSALGVTKGSTLREVAAELGIEAHEVVAAGDMPNDASMLAWAGSSFAVDGAHPTARAAAKASIGSNAHEAVADVMQAILNT